MKRIAALIAVAALAVGWAGSSLAQTAPHIVRGVVTAVSADSVTIKSREGPPVTVVLAPNWTVAVMKPVAADAIQPGSFIGTAEMPQADGTGLSLEVHVFPPGVKMGEGHYAWDLRPGSMMTNGTVGTAVAGHGGREIEVAYAGGTRHLVVPEGVPIVQITGGTQALVAPGVAVFMIARPTPDGAGLITNSLSVGADGKAPPM